MNIRSSVVHNVGEKTRDIHEQDGDHEPGDEVYPNGVGELGRADGVGREDPGARDEYRRVGHPERAVGRKRCPRKTNARYQSIQIGAQKDGASTHP
jgi:hypothetical protein